MKPTIEQLRAIPWSEEWSGFQDTRVRFTPEEAEALFCRFTVKSDTWIYCSDKSIVFRAATIRQDRDDYEAAQAGEGK